MPEQGLQVQHGQIFVLKLFRLFWPVCLHRNRNFGKQGSMRSRNIHMLVPGSLDGCARPCLDLRPVFHFLKQGCKSSLAHVMLSPQQRQRFLRHLYRVSKAACERQGPASARRGTWLTYTELHASNTFCPVSHHVCSSYRKQHCSSTTSNMVRAHQESLVQPLN